MSDVAAAEFIRAIGPVARELLGEPTQASSRELRFGTRGSLSIKCPSLNNRIIRPVASARWYSSIRRGKRRVGY